jgi:hypothetical protein
VTVDECRNRRNDAHLRFKELLMDRRYFLRGFAKLSALGTASLEAEAAGF